MAAGHSGKRAPYRPRPIGARTGNMITSYKWIYSSGTNRHYNKLLYCLDSRYCPLRSRRRSSRCSFRLRLCGMYKDRDCCNRRNYRNRCRSFCHLRRTLRRGIRGRLSGRRNRSQIQLRHLWFRRYLIAPPGNPGTV